MSVPESLERDLGLLLREDASPRLLAALDARVERIAAGSPATTGRWQRAWGVMAAALGALVIVLVAVVALAGRPDAAPAATPTLPAAVASEQGTPSPEPTLEPLIEPIPQASPSDTVAPTPIDTPALTGAPTAAPTDRPTPKLTPKPTPKPTNEPQPGGEAEPTPRTWSDSGPLGAPLTIHGATLTMSRTDVPSAIGDVCARKGWETWAYDVHLAWKNPAGSVEPYLVAGEHGYNVIWWETAWKANTDQVGVVCHKPGDSARVLAETTPDGIPITDYVWRFTP